MIIIPGWLIALLTFPGIVIHEIAHRFFCDVTKTPVYAIKYFSLENPNGYVIHGPTKGIKQSFLIAIGPLFINTLLCMIITFSAIIPISLLEQSSFLFYFLLWIGFSIGAHAFPSNTDIKSFVDFVKRQGKVGFPLSFILILMIGLFKVVNILRFVWFDFIYAISISVLLPIISLNCF